ncbi:suppressor of fused homolog [Stomoxys calcitrans]|uniref:Suppressor of fused homolog n=1 Tax=Stomoxys calcitrans TaxID=35570 RepID=A0A1I8NTR4_STOCA|nr:suppressor of fused homolog [Stomoxys calcitrans]
MAAAASLPNKPKCPPPAGLKALIDKLQSVYPDQPNPLQVTTVLKYWLGGQDPLDYISMFSNSGDPSKKIPPHWFYVSFGLSDLHGDGRVHFLDSEDNESNSRSGMGFELTFRLLKTSEELKEETENPNKRIRPPTWPANLMQNLARYCFRTGNRLCFGDNIPWRKGLDDRFDTPLQNILIAEDPQLQSMTTPFGTVDFCQIVGVTYEELEQAARWNGRGVLNYLKQDIQTGGEWWVTNIDRTLSVFDIFPERLVSLEEDLEREGSDLAGVNAEFTFREISKPKVRQPISEEDGLTAEDGQELNSLMDSMSLRSKYEPENQKCKQEDDLKTDTFPVSMSMSGSSLHNSCPVDNQPDTPDSVTLDGIELQIAPYAAKFLLLAIKDRIRHGRHFTFKAQHLALTFVAESVAGAGVTKEAPYGVLGYWIQVLITDDLVPRMIEDFKNANLDRISQLGERREFEWPDKYLKVIIDHPHGYMLPPPPMSF